MSYKNIRLFQNDRLEALTHIHPALPFVVWIPIITFFFIRGAQMPGLTLLGFVGCGVLSLLLWSFVEYMLHRFLFHYHPTSETGQRMIYLFHGVHHEDPQDPTRLVMPPIVSLLLGAVFYSLFHITTGEWCDLTFAFFSCGYLAYDYVHFATHHFTPKTFVGKFLKQNHMVHHFAEPETRWGVSSPLWDRVFGTSGNKLGAG